MLKENLHALPITQDLRNAELIFISVRDLAQLFIDRINMAESDVLEWIASRKKELIKLLPLVRVNTFSLKPYDLYRSEFFRTNKGKPKISPIDCLEHFAGYGAIDDDNYQDENAKFDIDSVGFSRKAIVYWLSSYDIIINDLAEAKEYIPTKEELKSVNVQEYLLFMLEHSKPQPIEHKLPIKLEFAIFAHQQLYTMGRYSHLKSAQEKVKILLEERLQYKPEYQPLNKVTTIETIAKVISSDFRDNINRTIKKRG